MIIRYMALLLACVTTLASAQPRQEIGNLVLDGVPAHSPRVVATLDKWLAGRSASFRDFLPDGSMLVSTRFGDAEQIHRVERPLATREQITFEAEPISLPLANP